MRKLCCLSIFIAAIAVCGCKEKESPLIKKGEALIQENQWDEAEKTFKEALTEDPVLAKAHLGLARIYQHNQKYLAHAIYHYDRFFELSPDAESLDLFKPERQAVEQMLVETVLNNSPQIRLIKKEATEKETAWRTEKEDLNNQITRLKEQLQTARTTTPRTTTPRTTTPRTTASAGNPIIYTSIKGDSLSKIAGRFYGDTSKFMIIYEANKDTLTNPNSLKVGQTLVIPELKE
jgi:tetratricopeptide (TPR) repeat protein